jgi:hypothetical protein
MTAVHNDLAPSFDFSYDPAPSSVVWDDAGNLSLGTRLDGGGRAWFDFVDDRHVHGGLITGPPRSGTSNAATLLTAAARAHLGLRVTTLYVDAYGGRSNPVLARHASIPVTGDTPPGAAIAALERAARLRTVINADRERKTCAGTELPILLAVVEDADLVVGAEPHRWTRLVRHSRTLNIAVLAVRYKTTGSVPGQRALWNLLARSNELRLHSYADPGRGRTRDVITGDPVDVQVPHVLTPAVDSEFVLPEAPLDTATATAIGELYRPRTP